jgi:putative copper export protein
MLPDTMDTTTDAGGVPVLAALVRGVALSSLMALGGVLFFAALAGGDLSAPSWRALGVLSVAACALLVVHFGMWTVQASVDHSLSRDSLAAVVSTRAGTLELWRLALAGLVMWAVALARRVRLALFLALGVLLVSGASGHSAAIHPEWGIPAKALHLIAGAAWLGGLVWLFALARREAPGFSPQAHRVSSIALAAVVAVAFSGIVQLRLFLPSWADLFHSAYGALALAKVAGLLILVGFGAYHRFIVLPGVGGELPVRGRFASTLRSEMAVMALVIVLGAFLAYTPPPSHPMSHEHSTSPVP